MSSTLRTRSQTFSRRRAAPPPTTNVEAFQQAFDTLLKSAIQVVPLSASAMSSTSLSDKSENLVAILGRVGAGKRDETDAVLWVSPLFVRALMGLGRRGVCWIMKSPLIFEALNAVK